MFAAICPVSCYGISTQSCHSNDESAAYQYATLSGVTTSSPGTATISNQGS